MAAAQRVIDSMDEYETRSIIYKDSLLRIVSEWKDIDVQAEVNRALYWADACVRIEKGCVDIPDIEPFPQDPPSDDVLGERSGTVTDKEVKE